jgi:hypothetical protein
MAMGTSSSTITAHLARFCRRVEVWTAGLPVRVQSTCPVSRLGHSELQGGAQALIDMQRGIVADKKACSSAVAWPSWSPVDHGLLLFLDFRDHRAKLRLSRSMSQTSCKLSCA